MLDQIHDQYFFILASASPRRKELLTLLGIPFVVVVPESPSPEPDSKVEPGAYNVPQEIGIAGGVIDGGVAGGGGE